MSLASLARSERADLCDLMVEVGPDAPTLNEGWTVLDLAAHLVAREHDLWGGPGIVLGGPMAKLTHLAMARRRRQGLERLVSILRRGEPLWFRVAPAGTQLNEFFIHHEDVRRPNGHLPRTDRTDLDEALVRLVRGSARLLLRNFDGGIDLVWNGGVVYRRGSEPRAELSGPPGEMLLYLSGRREAAHVELGGDPDAVAALERARLGT
jgi:uncharacterized protein (TIGR03085 family)